VDINAAEFADIEKTSSWCIDWSHGHQSFTANHDTIRKNYPLLSWPSSLAPVPRHNPEYGNYGGNLIQRTAVTTSMM